MQAIYKLHCDELDERLIASIKSLFQHQRLVITIEADVDETEYLLSNPANAQRLTTAIQNAKEGRVIEVDVDTLLKQCAE